jgi:hypothetical protein
VVSLTKLKMNVCVCYRPPNSENLTPFFNLLEPVLSKYRNLIFLGDININLIDITSTTSISYQNIIASHGYNFLNKITSSMATRVTSHSATIIDHALTNLKLDKFQSVIINKTFLSDHNYMLISLRHPQIPKPFLKKPYVKTNFQNIQSKLIDLPSDSFHNFHLALQQLVEDNKKTIQTNSKLSVNKPWFIPSLSKIAKKRDKFYALKKKFPSNLYISEKFNRYRNLFRKSIREAKRKYFGNRLKGDIGNPKKVWEVSNEIIRNTTDTSDSEICLNIDNKAVESPGEVANHLNKFFVSVGSVSSKIPIPIYRQVPENISFSCFSPTTPEEISEIIKSLENPAAGYDSIKSNFIKEN